MRILVLDIPALHLGYLGCYGNDWVGTPNIDRLAAESIVFNRHFFDVRPLEPAALEETLGANGIALDYVSAEGSVSAEALEETVEKTSDALARQRPFIWARFPSLAPPWDLPEELLNSYCEDEDRPWPDPPLGVIADPDELPRLQNTYAAVVTAVDAYLERIVDQVRAKDHHDGTLVCLTSSAGLPLGEQGVLGLTRPWPHEEFVHVPLLLRLPGGQHPGWRVDALTQPVDLVPTLLEFLGVHPANAQGRSLWPLIRGETSEVRQYAMSALPRDEGMAWALRTREWAFILPIEAPADEPRRPRLYVKPEDRWEVNDVCQHHLELAEEFERILRELGKTPVDA